MLNTIGHLGNTNQNHNVVPFHTHIATVNKKADNNKCWQEFRETKILIPGRNIKLYSHLENSLAAS